MNRMQNRVFQDKRRQTRIHMQIDCQFKSNDKEYDALMLDLSNGGTLLSHTFDTGLEDLPVQEDKISITLDMDGLKVPLTLTGTVKRSSYGVSEFGNVVQFGVEFEDKPLELLKLINFLSARRKRVRV